VADGDREAEAHPVEADLAVRTGYRVRSQLAVVGEVVRRHQLDGLAAENARPVELTAVGKHLREPQIVHRGRHETATA
jgi:hypothetical protein